MDDYSDLFGDKVIFKDHLPAHLELISVEEGEFKNGLKNGYARVISPNTEIACEAGFFLKGEPHGKHTFYRLDGSFSQPEGIYSQGKLSARLGIAHYGQSISRVD